MLSAAAVLLACKAVLTPLETAGCRSIEFDLSLTSDGVLVLSHEPVDRPWSEVRGRLLDLDSFVEGLKGRHFEMADLDLKERSILPGDGRLSAAFERHARALKALSEQTGHMEFGTPIPARYAEVERWLRRAGLRAEPAYEVVDYGSAEARRWGLPISWWEKPLLPLARAANAAYRLWRGREIRALVMQETTAASWTSPAGASIICWTRDPASGPPPAACTWDERESPSALARASLP